MNLQCQFNDRPVEHRFVGCDKNGTARCVCGGKFVPVPKVCFCELCRPKWEPKHRMPVMQEA